MFYLYSYSNINDKGDAKTEGTTLFVGNCRTFNTNCYSTICQLPGLSIPTIRAAIANHFPEYLI